MSLLATLGEARSSALELVFLHHPLVRLAVALDTVLELAVAARQLAEHFVIACNGDAELKSSAEPDHLSNVESVGQGGIELLIGAQCRR
jgi:hypothetical protein